MFNNNNRSAQNYTNSGFIYNHPTRDVPASFINSLYGWMTLGLALTAGVGYLLSPAVNPELFARVAGGPLWIVMLVQIGIAFYHASNWQTLSVGANLGLFSTYAALNGVLLAPLAYIYTGASIVQTFLVAAGTFLIMSIYGYFTSYNMLGIGSYLRMALIGMCVAILVNMFFASTQMELLISLVGVVIFTVLTAYDTQVIKELGARVSGSENRQKLAIVGALTLYLDLINLFIYLLRFMGKKKD